MSDTTKLKNVVEAFTIDPIELANTLHLKHHSSYTSQKGFCALCSRIEILPQGILRLCRGPEFISQPPDLGEKWRR